MTDSYAWAPGSTPAGIDDRGPYGFRPRLEGFGLTFPAEISIRPALQASYQRRPLESEQPSISPAPQLPYPTTPHQQHLAYPHHQPRLVDPNRFKSSQQLPPARPSSFKSRYDSRHHHEPTSNPHHHGGFMILPDERSSHRAKRSEVHFSKEANLYTNRPPQDASSVGMDRDVRQTLIEDVRTGRVFVEKRRTVISIGSRKRHEAEANALWRIKEAGSSPHITSIYEVFFDPTLEQGIMVLEFCDCGTLEDFINRYIRERKSTPEDFAWHVLSSLASALCMTHLGIADPAHPTTRPRVWTLLHHFNIRPASIKMSSRGTTCPYPRVVLGDFDCVVTDINSGEVLDLLRQQGGSAWLPPEAQDRPTSVAILGWPTDIWQLGAVIMAMCRLVRYPDTTLINADRPCGSQYSPALNNIVSCCLNHDYNNRPAAVDVGGELSKQTSRGKTMYERRC